jgi:hypothetical protein
VRSSSSAHLCLDPRDSDRHSYAGAHRRSNHGGSGGRAPLLAAGLVSLVLVLVMGGPAVALVLSVDIDTPQPVLTGTSGVVVSIRADEDLAVGSTDVTLNWSMPGLQFDSASSSSLSGFTSFIENDHLRVKTGSSAIGSNFIMAGTPLMTFTLTARLKGTYVLFITDGDNTQPDDLAGPIPPIPPISIPYDKVNGLLHVVPEPGTAALMFGPLVWLLRARQHSAHRSGP